MLKSKLVALAAVSAATLAVAPSAHAATDYFMRIDPAGSDKQIQGESQDKAYPGSQGYIQIKSFDFGIENPTTIGSMSGGAGAGKAKLNALTVEKDVDSTTPQLLQHVGQGQHFAGIEIVARKAGGNPTVTPPATRYYFSTAFATADEQSGDAGEEAPQEKLTFVYGGLAEKVVRQLPTGALASPVFGSWNQVTNTTTLDQLPSNWQ